MEYLTLNRPTLTVPLWGLIRDDRYSDTTGQAFGCLFSKPHRCDGEWVDGLLLFATPLHAEIYRLWMQARGGAGWRRFCTTDDDIMRMIGNLQDERLQLWVAAGFTASETRQLLLDQNGLLMTSSVGIDLALSRDEDGNVPALRLPSQVVRLLQNLSAEDSGIVNAIGDGERDQRVTCDDEAWEEHASAALGRIATQSYDDYQKDWRTESPSVALAQFDRHMNSWLFIGRTADRWH